MNQDYPKDLPLEAVALLWDKVRGKQVPLGRLLCRALLVKVLHNHMADDQLQVFCNLHVVNCKVERMLSNRLTCPTRISQYSKCVHAE